MMTSTFVLVMLQLTTMLGAALILGQLMRRLGQPAVLGEMLGGLLIGPTLFGAVFPSAFEWLFAASPDAAMIRDSSVRLGMLFFLFVAGSEIDLSDLKRQGRQALSIGTVGTILPILVGVGVVYALPLALWGPAAAANLLPFGLFIGINLANSANPVLARILIDLGLMKTPMATLSMAATIVDDLINWALFAIILGLVAVGSPADIGWGSIAQDLGLIALLFVAILGGLRSIAPRMLHWARTHLAWPSGFIAFTALLILGTASASEYIGLHAFLGAFLVGAALGGHDEEHEEAHGILTNFSLSFFAPLFFVSMGMTTNFITNFDVVLVLVITVVAVVSKLAAVLLGARMARMPIDRNAWAIGFGLNARGATGIILAGVGRQAGVIDDRVFVALVVMAIITSVMAGPAMTALLDVDHTGHDHVAAADDPLVAYDGVHVHAPRVSETAGGARPKVDQGAPGG